MNEVPVMLRKESIASDESDYHPMRRQVRTAARNLFRKAQGEMANVR